MDRPCKLSPHLKCNVVPGMPGLVATHGGGDLWVPILGHVVLIVHLVTGHYSLHVARLLILRLH
jgi:hypothetical protein